MSLETKRALLRAALAAQDANESHITKERIIAELLKTPCAADDYAAALSRVQPRPLEPAVKEVFDDVLKRHGQIAIAPLDLLRELKQLSS